MSEWFDDVGRDVEDARDLVSVRSVMFCKYVSFSFWYAVQLLLGGDFFCKAWVEAKIKRVSLVKKRQEQTCLLVFQSLESPCLETPAVVSQASNCNSNSALLTSCCSLTLDHV